MRPLPLLLLLLPALTACTLVGPDGDDRGDDRPTTELRAAPDTLALGTLRLVAEASVWRDLTPGPGPDTERGLIAHVVVRDVDGVGLGALEAEQAWVLRGDDARWRFEPVQVGDPPGPPDVRELRGQGGPEWEGGTRATVVVELRDGEGRRHLLRAPDTQVWIAL